MEEINLEIWYQRDNGSHFKGYSSLFIVQVQTRH